MAGFHVDPFIPDRPAESSESFTGRLAEVSDLLRYLFNTAHQQPKHVLITGDRGIGKSSLLRQAQKLASGDRQLIDRLRREYGDSAISEPPKFNFATVWHTAESSQDAHTLANALIEAAQYNLENFFGGLRFEFNWLVTIKKDSSEPRSVADLAQRFCAAAKKASDRISAENRSGLIFCIDEADAFPRHAGVAVFFKLVIDTLFTSGVKNVAFMLAGITGALQKLMEDHPSVSRSFHEILVPPLSQQDGSSILRNGFKAAGVTYDETVIDDAFAISAGFPEPLHLLGSTLLDVDTDGHLTTDDLRAAKRKLVENTRHSELEASLIRAGSGINQRVLRAMASTDRRHTTNEQIRSALVQGGDDCSRALQDLVERNFIRKVGKGTFEFVNPLLNEFIVNYGVIDVDEPSTSGT